MKPLMTAHTLWSTLILLAAIGPPLAKADLLPIATTFLQAAAWPNNCSLDCTTEIFNGPLGQPALLVGESYAADPLGAYPAGYATAIAFQRPEVTAEAAGNAGAYSELTYYFYINGPANTIVPITFAGILTNEGGGAFNDLGADITNPVTSSILVFAPFPMNSIDGFNTTPISPFSVTANATSDVVYQVQLFAEASADFAGQIEFGDTNLGPPQYVDVDPVISISSTFAGANQFQLDFSPGIDNSFASTPEPSSVVLLLTALVAVALVARKTNCPKVRTPTSVGKRPMEP